MQRVLFFVASAILLGGASYAHAQQNQIPSYSDARDVFWDELYGDDFEEFYCGRRHTQRNGHNIEHIFPAFWMTKAFGCGSRKSCRRSSKDFNKMEGDLHNLYPTRIPVNSLRGSFPFGIVPGEDIDFSGCDFEENSGVVEPRPAVRGDVARAVLYMAKAYDAASGVPTGQLELMHQWDAIDPPSTTEKQRNDLIAELQGNRNPFIDTHENGGIAAVSPMPAKEEELLGQSVRIATWNIANLHHETGVHLPGRSSAAKRSDADFERIAGYITGLNADIIAFQEVNGPKAAKRIFPENEYHIILSNRYDADIATGRKTDYIYTGVAVKKDGAVNLIASQTYEDLSISHKEEGSDPRPTRAGSEVLVELPNGQPLQVMSVHLKSGCNSGRLDFGPGRESDRAACRTLAAQRAPLEAWIDERTEENIPFIIAGDWNRRIDNFDQQDHLWQEIDDADPVPLDLFRYPSQLTSVCLKGTSGHFPKMVDFIVADEQAARWVDRESVTVVDFKEKDRPQRKLISDHCPVYLDIKL